MIPRYQRLACDWCGKPATPGHRMQRDEDGDPCCSECLARSREPKRPTSWIRELLGR